ncbi:MAG: PaaI family thioesterase [Candidatus Dormibacteraeota bacterium]|nr:PaaI family thioesterase [Candidatus Dormibacteraeota bacterium]
MLSRRLGIEELSALIQRYEFTRRYGFEVVDAGDGTCDILVPYLAEHDRPGGIVSGQVYMHAADVAFWLAVKTRLGAGEEYVTSSMTTAFLSSARAQAFTCHARVIKTGRRLIFGDAECRAGERPLTHHTLTYVGASA